MHTTSQTSGKPQNADCNGLRNQLQQPKTTFNLCDRNSSNQVHQIKRTHNPDRDTITRKVDQKTEMKLIQGKKYR